MEFIILHFWLEALNAQLSMHLPRDSKIIIQLNYVLLKKLVIFPYWVPVISNRVLDLCDLEYSLYQTASIY